MGIIGEQSFAGLDGMGIDEFIRRYRPCTAGIMYLRRCKSMKEAIEFCTDREFMRWALMAVLVGKR